MNSPYMTAKSRTFLLEEQMTNEHLNTQLYWRLHREHIAFKNWLMTQPPAVIIENAYKYAMMEDVLLTFESDT